MSYTLIERKELTSPALAIDFTNIPQYFTDIIVISSLRATWTGVYQNISLTFNGSTADYSWRLVAGDGSSTFSASGTRIDAVATSAGSTANTFSNSSFYIPNYSSNATKSVSIDTVSENNASSNPNWIAAGLWSNTAPITSLTVSSIDQNFLAGSSISLYGINRQQAIGAPKAFGGAINFANGYWYHTFTGSGNFTPAVDLEVDALVVAGGGGGSNYFAGGGGAGGVRTFSASGFKSNTSYPVIIGAGGAGAEPTVMSGSVSSFSGYSATGGGAAKRWSGAGNPNGGSGGGAALNFEAGGTGNAGGYTPPEGFAGGAGGRTGGNEATGGGGGASAPGGNSSGSGTVGGNGGAGILWNSSYYAGGGGGGSRSSTPGTGGLGGGGNGGQNANGTNGQAATGGGAGGSAVENLGSPGTMPNGGSGVVIIRYKA